MVPSLIWAKKETTYGVDSVPAALNFIWAENVRHQLLGSEEGGDPARPGVAPFPTEIYGEHAEVSFEVPLAASGTAGTAPKWGPLIQACSVTETVSAGVSVTYARRSDPALSDSLTLIYRADRELHKLTGARGRVGLRLQAGKRPMLVFTFRGLHTDVATGSRPVQADATWTGWGDAKPIAQGRTTFAFNAVNLALRELTLDPTDNIVFNDLPHQENVQLLGGLAWSGRLRATTPLPSALNLDTLWKARTILTAAMVHGATAGQIVTVNMKGQLGAPEYGEENNERVFSAPWNLKPSAYNLDDDFSIVLT